MCACAGIECFHGERCELSIDVILVQTYLCFIIHFRRSSLKPMNQCLLRIN
jgi:hypothetical protein